MEVDLINNYFEKKNGSKNTLSGGTWKLVKKDETTAFMFTTCKDEVMKDGFAKVVMILIKDGKLDTMCKEVPVSAVEQMKKQWGGSLVISE